MRLLIERTSDGAPAWNHIKCLLLGSRGLRESGAVCLKAKSERRTTFRMPVSAARTVIVKVWRRDKLTLPMYRAAYSFSTAYREWRMPQRLRNHGIATAASLAYFGVAGSEGAYTEVVVKEDLGECESALGVFSRAFRASDAQTMEWVERSVIDITARMISEGFVDTDHRLANFVVPADGVVQRLDLEHCRYFGPMARYAARPLGRMLGTLIGTYAFVVQPDMSRARSFAARTLTTVRATHRVTTMAQCVLDEMMLKQKDQSGIDMRLVLSTCQ